MSKAKAPDAPAEQRVEATKRVSAAAVPDSVRAWANDPTSKPAYYMTNVNNEKLQVTPKQWERYGQRLMASGWLEPEFAKERGIVAGNEAIPADVDWGKDKT